MKIDSEMQETLKYLQMLLLSNIYICHILYMNIILHTNNQKWNLQNIYA